MSKKPKYTRKDDYLLMLGVSIALMFQVVYDMLHEVYFKNIDLGWLGIQTIIITVLVVYGIAALRKTESYS
jgi:hypothetical protein